MVSTVTPRQRRCPLREPGGGDHVRRRVDELAGDVDPARDERGAVGHGRELLAAPADHEALDAARRLTAAPAAGVVAADDRAFGQRAHLLLDGEGQGRVERPRDRPAAAARAHRPRRSGPQPVDAGLERDDGERRRRAVYTIATGSASAIARSGAPSSTARAPAATATRSAPIADGSPARYLDMHRVTTTIQ